MNWNDWTRPYWMDAGKNTISVRTDPFVLPPAARSPSGSNFFAQLAGRSSVPQATADHASPLSPSKGDESPKRSVA